MNDIVKILSEHRGLSDPVRAEKLSVVTDLLKKENGLYNLTALKSDGEIAILHLYDSLSLLDTGIFTGQSVIDVGSGAGFPALPLAVCAENCAVTANDSTRKKLDFIEKAALAADIKNIKTLFGRAEELPSAGYREKFGAAVARGVAGLDILCELCLPLVKKGGFFVAMKGAGAAAELKEAENAIGVTGGKIAGVKKIKIPVFEREHHIVIIEKIKETPGSYPRRFSRIKKSPL